MAMSENSKKILNYLKGVTDNVTAADVAAALDLPKQTVNGAFTSAIQRKGLGNRVEAEVEDADGVVKTIKFLTLNDAGKAFDPDAETEA